MNLYQVSGDTQGNVAVMPALLHESKSMLAEQSSATAALDRDRLISDHLPMVRLIARRMHARLPQHVELEELVSAGTVGLIDAVQKFDQRKQVQFRSYAQFRIRGAIVDYLRTLDWSPRELRRKARGVEEAISLLTARLGRTPAEGEIAAELGLPLKAYQQLLGELKSLDVGSLNVERGQEGGEEELAYIPGPESDSPLFRLMQGEMRERVAAAIDDLPEKERIVLSLRYFEDLSMKEIGAVLGVVESRASQIHTSAILGSAPRWRQRGRTSQAAGAVKLPVGPLKCVACPVLLNRSLR